MKTGIAFSKTFLLTRIIYEFMLNNAGLPYPSFPDITLEYRGLTSLFRTGGIMPIFGKEGRE